MREILFRAKRDKRYCETQDWTYGVPFIDYDDDCIFKTSYSELVVMSETVGQYTGLKDKNGTKIFEGDIIKYFENNSVFEIKFNRIGYDSGVGLTGFVCVDDKRYCKEVDYDTKEEFYICDRCVDLKQVEVIGNIYDNPELLEE